MAPSAGGAYLNTTVLPIVEKYPVFEHEPHCGGQRAPLGIASRLGEQSPA